MSGRRQSKQGRSSDREGYVTFAPLGMYDGRMMDMDDILRKSSGVVSDTKQ